jgi:hypothetical protein
MSAHIQIRGLLGHLVAELLKQARLGVVDHLAQPILSIFNRSVNTQVISGGTRRNRKAQGLYLDRVFGLIVVFERLVNNRLSKRKCEIATLSAIFLTCIILPGATAAAAGLAALPAPAPLADAAAALGAAAPPADAEVALLAGEEAGAGLESDSFPSFRSPSVTQNISQFTQ